MQQLLTDGVLALFAFSAFVALFFFVLTRGTLLVRALSSRSGGEISHVYPIYSNMRLIKLIDYQFIISAILLFQYHRLVKKIVSELGKLDLENKTVLITSCAFGNVIPEIVKAALQAGAARILVTDIIKNELIHAESKLGDVGGKVEFIEEDATAMHLADNAVDVNIVFFLLHELPHHLKQPALHEASRLLAPGGKLFLAEFHRPDSRVLRLFSWVYFKVFEPYGLALWDTHDPLAYLLSIDGWCGERYTCFNGNFQVISATRS
jgi:ubiquinone/menaquinone biosynthesis C-methylase UbiE